MCLAGMCAGGGTTYRGEKLSIDPEENAKTELATAMVPTPEDIADMLTPLTMLYFMDRVGWVALTSLTAMGVDLKEIETADTGDLGSVVNMLADIVGQLDGLCAHCGLLPASAVLGPA